MAFHTLNINNSFFELAPFKVKAPVLETNANYFIPFLSGNPGCVVVDKITGLKDVNPSSIYIAGNRLTGVGGKFYYNPSSNILTVGNVKITGTNSSTATIKADAATNMYVDIGGNVPLDIKYDSTDKFIACGSSFSNLVNLGTSARKWANVYATTFHGDLDGIATYANYVHILPMSSANATYYVTFANASSGKRMLSVDATLLYNPSTNTLTATTFKGNLNGPVQTTATSTNTSYYISFVNASATGMRYSYVDSNLYYNPSTNVLTISSGKVEATQGFYETSDERLKDFQEDIEVNFSYLHNIPKKYYSWKDDATYTRHIGTSAQEVQKYYPELVNTDETGYLTMNYDKLSVVALKAIDVLHEEVTELKKENAELKERLARLEELILNK